jgi:hypothetical protein
MIPLRSLFKLAREVLFPTRAGFITIRLAQRMTLELYDRPGAWASDTELESITHDLRSVYARAMAGTVAEYGALRGERADMARRVISIIRDADGRALAFCAQARLRVKFGNVIEDVIHLGLVSIDPDYHRRGLQGVLYALPVIYLFFLEGMARLYFTNVTQVPAIIGQCEDYFFDVYPSSKAHAHQQFHHRRIATTVYEQYRSVFGVGDDSVLLPETQIIRNAYTGGSDLLKKTFAQCAQHRREAVNELCRQQLDYDRGDDFIQVGWMDYLAGLSFFEAHGGTSLVRRMSIRALVWWLRLSVIPLMRWILIG